jgi:hypothetical protein
MVHVASVRDRRTEEWGLYQSARWFIYVHTVVRNGEALT